MKSKGRNSLDIFNLDFEIFRQQKPSQPASISTLSFDLFPFFTCNSVSLYLIVLNIIGWFISQMTTTQFLQIIPGMNYFERLTNTILCLFAYQKGYLLPLLCQSVFLVLIGSYIQKKLGMRQFLFCYCACGIFGNIFCQILLLTHPLCCNLSTYSLYGVSLFLQYEKQSLKQKIETQIYKLIVFSFLVYAGTYKMPFCHIDMYIGGYFPLIVWLKYKNKFQKENFIQCK